MATNNFKAFAIDPNANVMSQADWEALPALLSGFISGPARSAQMNKAIRQATTIAALVGQFIANSGVDALDNADVNGLVTKFTNALIKNLSLDTKITIVAQGSNANGKWRQYSDGSIEMWGLAAAPGSDGIATVNYPIALPASPTEMGISVSQFTSATPTTPTTTIVMSTTITSTKFQSKTVNTVGPTGSGFSWRVIYAAF